MNKLKYQIVGLNDTKGAKAAEKTMQALGKTARKVTKDAGKTSLADAMGGKHLARFSKGIDLGKGLVDLKGVNVGRSLSELVGGFGEAAEGATLLEGALGGAALGMGAFAGLAIAAGIAAYKFSQPWINAGANLANLRASLGMTARDIQGFEMAGKQFGIEQSAMDQSLAGVAAFGHAAIFDPGANEQRALLNKLGIRLDHDASGNFDVSKLYLQLADAVKDQRTPGGAAHVAAITGTSSSLPLLRQGSAGVRRAMQRSLAIGGSYTDADIAASVVGRQNDVLNQQGLSHLTHIGQRVIAQPVMAMEGLAAKGLAAVWGAPSAEGPRSVVALHTASTSLETAVKGKLGPAADKLKSSADALQRLADSIHTGGMRRNNPGNIRPMSGHGFNNYPSIEDGLSAMGGQLRAYEHKHGLDTIDGIIGRWAPPADHNPTTTYEQHVSERTGFKRDQHLDLDNDAVLANLMAAMIAQEQGKNPFSKDQISDVLAQRHEHHFTFELQDKRIKGSVKTRTAKASGVGVHHFMMNTE